MEQLTGFVELCLRQPWIAILHRHESTYRIVTGIVFDIRLRFRYECVPLLGPHSHT